MPWKKDYLANLVELASADGVVENRELLALFEIERRLHATISDFIGAMEKARYRETDTSGFNHLVERRHLSDLFAVAFVDATVSDMEQELIGRFVEQSGLPENVIDELREAGVRKAEGLIQRAVETRLAHV